MDVLTSIHTSITPFGPDGQCIQCQTGDLGAACIYSMQYYQQQGAVT